MKRFTLLMAGAVALGLTACGPADYTGGGGVPGDPGSLFDRGGNPPIDTTAYEFVDYGFLRSTLTDTLGVAGQNDPDNPETSPVAYMDARMLQLGGSNYQDPSPDNAVTGDITVPGMKTWIFSASGACGIAMQGGAYDALFPQGVSSLDTVYLVLLSRYPSAAEVTVFNELFQTMEQTWIDKINQDATSGGVDPVDLAKYQDAYNNADSGNRRKAAAVCSTILSSMEFLTIN